ncbi:hypothetical protein Leryth_017562 [Lithospermum erythrorhizon]|nr:hypothetical protein Leryth_017562 [Lithospermum erythrorhizon]
MARTLKSKPGSLLLHRFTTSPPPVRRRFTHTLAFDEVRGSSDKPYTLTAFILHGLLGSGRNWRSFSRSLASSLPPDWRMVCIDLRNHGRSADIKELLPPHNMENAAKDVANLVKANDWKWPDVVIGHSMGGKVALQFAQSCARGDFGQSIALPKQLWVLDSVPGTVDPVNTSGEVEKVLETLQSLPSPILSRKWLVEHMLKLGFSKALSEWLGSNLKKSGEQETWAFNLEGAIQMFDSYRDRDFWPLLERPPDGMEISIVRAENSDRWDPDTIQRLESLSTRRVNKTEGKLLVDILPKSGHWVHVENPNGLIEIMSPRIASLA